MDAGSAAWMARMALQWIGAAMAARGFGDEGLWSALSGAVLAAGGALWSWQSRKAQIAMDPPR